MAESRKWVVTTSPDRAFGEVARELESAGFAIEQELDAIGVVIGAGDDDLAERLRGVKGVTDVSPDTPIDVGPPDSPRTW
jgi:hypothetical protein